MIRVRANRRGGSRLHDGQSSMRHSAGVLAILLLTAFGCSGGSGEPPLSLGDGSPRRLARKTKLVGREGGPADLRPGNDFLKYEVEYPNHGLKSIATVGLMFGSMREEVFPKKWRVIYDYEGTWEGLLWHEAYGIPLSIEIYAYSGGEYGRVINTYRLSKIVPNYPVYTDQSGQEKTIAVTYFQVAPGLR